MSHVSIYILIISKLGILILIRTFINVNCVGHFLLNPGVILVDHMPGNLVNNYSTMGICNYRSVRHRSSQAWPASLTDELLTSCVAVSGRPCAAFSCRPTYYLTRVHNQYGSCLDLFYIFDSEVAQLIILFIMSMLKSAEHNEESYSQHYAVQTTGSVRTHNMICNTSKHMDFQILQLHEHLTPSKRKGSQYEIVAHAIP